MQTEEVLPSRRRAGRRSGRSPEAEVEAPRGPAPRPPLASVALDHHGLEAAGGHPARKHRVREAPRREKLLREVTDLLPSLMPLSAVLPSLLTNRRRLLSESTNTVRAGGAGSTDAALGLLATFTVVDIGKVLALDDFLHDVVGVHAGVVDPGGMRLHRVLFPPETRRG